MAAIVRGEAAAALGKSQDPRVVDLLGELLEDSDVDVQGKAAMALAQVKNDKAKAYLTLQYGRRGRQTRQVIVQALMQANVPGPMAEVVAAESKGIWERNLLTLSEGSLPERVGAAEELGKSGRPEAFNRLLPLVRDSQVVLAAAAVRGLGDLGDKRAAPAILPLLDESFPELRESAITALVRLQEPQAIVRLQAVAGEKSAVSPLAIDGLLELPRQPQTDAALCAVALDAVTADAIRVARAMRDRGGCPLEPIAERLSRLPTAASGLQAVVGLGSSAKELLPRCCPSCPSRMPRCARSPWTRSRPSRTPPPRPCCRRPTSRNSPPSRPRARTGSPSPCPRSTARASIPASLPPPRRTATRRRRRSSLASCRG
ncbi:HEAT repeat domain-containing protein [Cystobacter fuscus]